MLSRALRRAGTCNARAKVSKGQSELYVADSAGRGKKYGESLGIVSEVKGDLDRTNAGEGRRVGVRAREPCPGVPHNLGALALFRGSS